MTFATLARYYKNAAVVLLNTVVALVVINGFLYLAITIRYRYFHPDRDNPVMRHYLDQTWSTIYPGMAEADIELMLRETWERRERYSPVTQHAERAFDGKYVNVSPAGFREHQNQGPWPIDDRYYNIFVFGGSTTFGYGVPDDESFPAYLQRAVLTADGREVRVYNFGNSSFHSTPERARFEHLLMTDQIPDMAIFVDGLNEFARPIESDEMQSVEAAYDEGVRSPLRLVVERLPMVRAGRAVKRRIVRRVRSRAADHGDKTQDTTPLIESAIDRYLHNVQLCKSAAAAYGVVTIFVWQPVPMYHYDLSRHPFARGGFPNNPLAAEGYAYFDKLLERSPLDSSFHWCADMQQDLDGLLYVDKIHYSARMNERLAQEIATFARSSVASAH